MNGLCVPYLALRRPARQGEEAVAAAADAAGADAAGAAAAAAAAGAAAAGAADSTGFGAGAPEE